jgi:pimeloyl-ACP methyl ester carboxylesterase
VPATKDLGRVLDHLAVDRAHVVGQSMGGWSALGFAIDQPDRVASLILADSTAGIFTPQIREALTAYGQAVVTETPSVEVPLGFHPAIGTQLLDEDPAQAFLYTQLGSLTEQPTPRDIMPLLMMTDHTQGALRIPCPTLFIVGEYDPIFPPEMIESAADLIGDSRVEIVASAGHSPYFEKASRWNDIVDAFLR